MGWSVGQQEEHDIVVRQPTLMERFAAEALGTFLLVFIGAGAASSVGLLLHSTGQPTSMADLLLVALAHGLALFIIVMIVGKISGAHVNPAVTIGLASIGRFPWEEVIAYVVAQIIGAIVGAAAILIVFGKLAATVGHLGAPALATNTSIVQGMVIEALGAGILVLTIVATAVDQRAPAGWAGLSIGLALGAIIMFIGPATGAAVNPARALGPDVVDLFFSVKIDWAAFVVSYLIGPILGGVGAAWLYTYIARLPRNKR
jgi:glycerol uptake facilitator protein